MSEEVRSTRHQGAGGGIGKTDVFQKTVWAIGRIAAIVGALIALFAVLPKLFDATKVTIETFNKDFPGSNKNNTIEVPGQLGPKGDIPTAAIVTPNATATLPPLGCTDILSTDVSVYPPKITHSLNCRKDAQ